VIALDPERRRTFEAAFVALLEQMGAEGSRLPEQVARTLDESLIALNESTDDGRSLSAFDVLRIRAGKFAATRLPARLYREPERLARLRNEIARLVATLLGPGARAGSRF
jgi:hypothetical protein